MLTIFFFICHTRFTTTKRHMTMWKTISTQCSQKLKPTFSLLFQDQFSTKYGTFANANVTEHLIETKKPKYFKNIFIRKHIGLKWNRKLWNAHIWFCYIVSSPIKGRWVFFSIIKGLVIFYAGHPMKFRQNIAPPWVLHFCKRSKISLILDKEVKIANIYSL